MVVSHYAHPAAMHSAVSDMVQRLGEGGGGLQLEEKKVLIILSQYPFILLSL